jgi:hypothetical protein
MRVGVVLLLVLHSDENRIDGISLVASGSVYDAILRF